MEPSEIAGNNRTNRIRFNNNSKKSVQKVQRFSCKLFESVQKERVCHFFFENPCIWIQCIITHAEREFSLHKHVLMAWILRRLGNHRDSHSFLPCFQRSQLLAPWIMILQIAQSIQEKPRHINPFLPCFETFFLGNDKMGIFNGRIL